MKLLILESKENKLIYINPNQIVYIIENDDKSLQIRLSDGTNCLMGKEKAAETIRLITEDC